MPFAISNSQPPREQECISEPGPRKGVEHRWTHLLAREVGAAKGVRDRGDERSGAPSLLYL